jgi:tetratricopeptide (TPR) repeat protein
MAYNLMGWAFLAKGDTTNSLKNLKAATIKDPELSATYLNLGMLYQKLGEIDNSRNSYEKAVSLAEKHGDKSIGDTAKILIDRINSPQLPSGVQIEPAAGTAPTGNQNPLSAPQTEFMPSLSLQ